MGFLRKWRYRARNDESYNLKKRSGKPILRDPILSGAVSGNINTVSVYLFIGIIKVLSTSVHCDTLLCADIL